MCVLCVCCMCVCMCSVCVCVCMYVCVCVPNFPCLISAGSISCSNICIGVPKNSDGLRH